MNLHIVPDNVFVNKFYENLQELGIAGQNKLVVRTNQRKLKYIRHNLPFASLYSAGFDELTGATQDYQNVFIHQFTPLLYRWVATHDFNKLNWMVWGSDLYNLPFLKTGLYEELTKTQYIDRRISLQHFLYEMKVRLLHDRYREKAYSKVDGVLTWMTSEFRFARQHIPELKAAHHFFFFIAHVLQYRRHLIRMRNYTGLFVLLLVSITSFSQGRPGRGGGQGMNNGRFYGKIVDEKTDKGIDAASVQLIGSRFDSASKTRRDTIISGMLTRKSGEFSLENLPVMGKFRLSISAIGYKSIDQPVSFNLNFAQGQDMSQAMAALDKDLGNIKLAIDTQMLASVTVSADKPMMQMGIDRKIFNVDKNITSAGGTAVDIMRNIPGLNVDIEGNVTLRNSAPQIFVDGRPTTLSLDQIPSDAIESVEMITNPSAKFDASGGQSGILNIVLKKSRKVGYNGGVRAGVDSRGRFA